MSDLHEHDHDHTNEHDHAHEHDHDHEDHDHEDHDHEHHHDHDHEHHHDHEDHDHHHEHDENCTCGCHDHDHHHHHADEVFTSWGMENVAPCKKEELEAFLQDLSKGDVYGQVLRAKGMIPSETEGEWYYFDLVPEEYEIRKGQPDYTGKVCVIGAKLDEEALKKVFHK